MAEVTAKLHGRRRRLWMTVPEFARESGTDPDTVRHRCQRGQYRCRKVGTRWRVWAGHLRP